MRHVLLVVLLVTSTPTASGATASVDLVAPSLETHGQGEIVVDAPQGGFGAARGSATLRLMDATGTLLVQTWNTTRASQIRQTTGAPSEVTYAIRGGRVDVVVDAEWWRVQLRSSGEASLAFPDEASGRPHFLAARIASRTAEGPADALPRPQRVAWTWEQGALYTGARGLAAPTGGFPPVPPGARVWVTGPLDVEFDGGNATFVDARGAPQRLRLGNWSTGPLGVNEHVDTVERRLLTFTGEATLEAVASEDWGLAGATTTWALSGRLVWQNATGALRLGDRVWSFTNARLEIRGALLLTPAMRGPLAAVDRYEGGGELEEVRINGALLAPAHTVAVPVRAGWTAALLLALAVVLWKVQGAFYTRIARADLLAHATRRRMVDFVTTRPGSRMRDVHAHVGGAWGPFTFHLRLLSAAGYLRTVRKGRLRLVFPVGPVVEAVPLPGRPMHPLARAILDALPPDGSPIAAPDLRSRVGGSRQRLEHHLGVLLASGRIARSVGKGRRAFYSRQAH